MNCRAIESLLLAERDGVLTTSQHASLEQHLATCPVCRQLRVDLAAAMSTLHTDAANVPLPDIDAEWNTFRARLGAASSHPEKKRSLAPIIWFGAPLAAAAALALVFFLDRPPSGTGETIQVADTASADFVEAGNASDSTMVYVDKESGWLVVWATSSESERSG